MKWDEHNLHLIHLQQPKQRAYVCNISGSHYVDIKSSFPTKNSAKRVVHGVRTGGDFIDEKLNQISSIHFLGSAVKESVNKAKDYKVFGIASYNDVLEYTRFIDVHFNIQT